MGFMKYRDPLDSGTADTGKTGARFSLLCSVVVTRGLRVQRREFGMILDAAARCIDNSGREQIAASPNDTAIP